MLRDGVGAAPAAAPTECAGQSARQQIDEPLAVFSLLLSHVAEHAGTVELFVLQVASEVIVASTVLLLVGVSQR